MDKVLGCFDGESADFRGSLWNWARRWIVPQDLGIMMERRHSKCLYLSPRSCLSVQARDSNLFAWYWISDPHILFLSRRADTSQILFSAWFCHRIFTKWENYSRIKCEFFFLRISTPGIFVFVPSVECNSMWRTDSEVIHRCEFHPFSRTKT